MIDGYTLLTVEVPTLLGGIVARGREGGSRLQVVMPSNSLFQMTTWCSWMVVAMETWCGSGMDVLTMVGMHTWYLLSLGGLRWCSQLAVFRGHLVAQVSQIMHL